MNDHFLGGRNAWLCGDEISIADYFASGVLSLGELIGCDFASLPHLRAWYQQMQDLPNWRNSNAALYVWADAVRGPTYLRL